MRVLVVGGSGFIGSHFINFVISKGCEVDSISLNFRNNLNIKNVNFINVDITDIQSLRNALNNREYNYVVNFGGYVNHKNYFEGGQNIIETHFDGLQNLIKTLNRKNLIKFIQIGSSDEYGDNSFPQIENMRELPFTPYSFAKTASSFFIQMLHKNENFPGVVLRFFLVYGPNQDTNRLIPSVIKNCFLDKEFPVSEGNQIRDFCYISDIVFAIYKTLIVPNISGEIINISSGNSYLLKDIINLIKSKINKGEPKFGALNYRTGENMGLVADINKAKVILDWEPIVEINQGLDFTIEWYKSNTHLWKNL